MNRRQLPGRRVALAAAVCVLPIATACSGGGSSSAPDKSPAVEGQPTSKRASTTTGLGAVGPLESSAVHAISVSFDQSAYGAMIATYTGTSEKDWLEATVTIDGSTYKKAGMRLKGNSSLRNISRNQSATSAPETLPWLIKLDKYVDGQDHKGLTDLVVRSNNSATSLNEAVALELLDLAGLASQDAIAASFRVNGSQPKLRLVIENPDSEWMAEEFADSGALYKAESTGNWSYRGTDPNAYENVFDQEAGKKNADLTPLIEFLDFLNNSDDAAFKAQLPQKLDIEGFAIYLAMQDLLGNFDDIDGPGNNSYLYYDTKTKQFTVVPWDYNLALGGQMGGPGGAGGPGGQIPNGGQIPQPGGRVGPNGQLPNGQVPNGQPGVRPGGGVGGAAGPGGPGGRSNVLVQRFTAVAEWQALYQQRLTELRAQLYASGVAAGVLDQWKAIVAATNLVDATTVDSEASRIAQMVR